MGALDWWQLLVVHLICRITLVLDSWQLGQSTAVVAIVDLLPSVKVLNVPSVLEVGTWTLVSLLSVKGIDLTSIGADNTSNTATHTIVALILVQLSIDGTGVISSN